MLHLIHVFDPVLGQRGHIMEKQNKIEKKMKIKTKA